MLYIQAACLVYYKKRLCEIRIVRTELNKYVTQKFGTLYYYFTIYILNYLDKIKSHTLKLLTDRRCCRFLFLRLFRFCGSRFYSMFYLSCKTFISCTERGFSLFSLSCNRRLCCCYSVAAYLTRPSTFLMHKPSPLR